jgi:integrating conjugative element protein (TIGR03749 family)
MVLVMLMFFSRAKADTEPSHLLWEKAPLQITLPIGKERWVSFPEAVEVINQDAQLTYDKLTLTNDAGTVYFKAHKAFLPSRLLVHLLQSGTVVLIDVSAAENADDTPLQVLVPRLSDVDAVHNNTNPVEIDNAASEATPIELIRYVISQIYPSIQESERPSDIHRVPLRSPKHVVLFYEANTTAAPLASWRSGDWYVTAVLIQNTLDKKITLDPRHIHGDWVAASLFPRNQLFPIRDPKAMTTIILLSHKPFQEALASIPLFAHKQLDQRP